MLKGVAYHKSPDVSAVINSTLKSDAKGFDPRSNGIRWEQGRTETCVPLIARQAKVIGPVNSRMTQAELLTVDKYLVVPSLVLCK